MVETLLDMGSKIIKNEAEKAEVSSNSFWSYLEASEVMYLYQMRTMKNFPVH